MAGLGPGPTAADAGRMPRRCRAAANGGHAVRPRCTASHQPAESTPDAAADDRHAGRAREPDGRTESCRPFPADAAATEGAAGRNHRCHADSAAPTAPAAEGAAEPARSRRTTAEQPAATTEAPGDTGLEQAEPKDVKLRFNFRYQPWEDVLDWLAEQADLSLQSTLVPEGTFNYSDTHEYTPTEAIDLINGVLLPPGLHAGAARPIADRDESGG